MDNMRAHNFRHLWRPGRPAWEEPTAQRPRTGPPPEDFELELSFNEGHGLALVNQANFEEYMQAVLTSAMRWLQQRGFIQEGHMGDAAPRVLYNKRHGGRCHSMYAWLTFPSPFWALTFYTIFHGFTWKGNRGSAIVICLKTAKCKPLRRSPT